jgi:hypothetical protein
MQNPKDWHERFNAERTDVERWSEARQRSAVRNRAWFLFATGLFVVVFGPLLVDAYLVLNSATWESPIGLDASTAPRMLQLSAVMAGVSFPVHVLIRLFWKRPVS